jgi:hypothetical protein
MEIIHKFSGGIPRLVNTLCENSLISGYNRQVKRITPQIVEEAASDLRLDPIASSFNSDSNGSGKRDQVLSPFR